MSRHLVSAADRADAAEFKHELLGRLGLPADASDRDVEAARNVLAEFLELAPHKVNLWAAAQTADVDEAFALLSGPEQILISAGQRASRVQRRLDETEEGHIAGPPTPPEACPVPATRKPRRNQTIGAIAVVGVVGAVFAVFQMGNASDVPAISGTPSGTQTTSSSSATTAPLDQTRVAALMKKISANPRDTASYLTLADAYFAASDFKNASVWEQKVLSLDPKNQKGLLSLGAAYYDQGNMTEALKPWLVAAKLYPKFAPVHNNLGYLYMSQTPPDNAKAIVEFNKVIAIDPKSANAQTVLTHLKGLQSSSPTASATPGAK